MKLAVPLLGVVLTLISCASNKPFDGYLPLADYQFKQSPWDGHSLTDIAYYRDVRYFNEYVTNDHFPEHLYPQKNSYNFLYVPAFLQAGALVILETHFKTEKDWKVEKQRLLDLNPVEVLPYYRLKQSGHCINKIYLPPADSISPPSEPNSFDRVIVYEAGYCDGKTTEFSLVTKYAVLNEKNRSILYHTSTGN